MVGKNTLKIYGFTNIYEYFNHILTNEINGNRKDVRGYIKKLSAPQKRDFLIFLNNESGEDAQIVKNLLLTL